MGNVPIYVALLRGINVGGKNKLAMKDLAAIFTRAGCADVQTYIQSGNVAFRASNTLATRIPDLVAAEIKKRFGLTIPVVTRSADEMRNVVEHNPFRRGVEHLHVAFLADKPSPARLRGLDPDRSPPDEFKVVGREVYLRCPGGVARTKLTNAYFDSALDTVSTMRNWNTVLKLFEMTQPRPAP